MRSLWALFQQSLPCPEPTREKERTEHTCTKMTTTYDDDARGDVWVSVRPFSPVCPLSKASR